MAACDHQGSMFNPLRSASVAFHRIRGVHQGQVTQALRRVAQSLVLPGSHISGMSPTSFW